MTEIKWGLTGCGDISRKRVVPGIQEAKNSKIIAINRSNFSKAESFAKEFGAEIWLEKWEDLVSFDGINAVYIATPVYLHAQQAIAAAEAGKHVLCEKPMAINSIDASRMIDACKANNVKLEIAYYRHFYPSIIRIKEIIASGEIGQIVHIQSNNFENFNRKQGEPLYWSLEKNKSGGGPMMGMGCHRIEVFLNIAGSIRKVVGFNNNIVFKREVEDSSIAHFEFENGATGVLTSSHAAKEPMDTLDIFGSEGSIHVPVLNEGILTVFSSAGTRTERHPNPSNIHQPLIEDFISAVLNMHEPAVGGNTGKEISRIIDTIYR